MQDRAYGHEAWHVELPPRLAVGPGGAPAWRPRPMPLPPDAPPQQPEGYARGAPPPHEAPSWQQRQPEGRRLPAGDWDRAAPRCPQGARSSPGRGHPLDRRSRRRRSGGARGPPPQPDTLPPEAAARAAAARAAGGAGNPTAPSQPSQDAHQSPRVSPSQLQEPSGQPQAPPHRQPAPLQPDIPPQSKQPGIPAQPTQPGIFPQPTQLSIDPQPTQPSIDTQPAQPGIPPQMLQQPMGVRPAAATIEELSFEEGELITLDLKTGTTWRSAQHRVKGLGFITSSTACLS